MKVEKLLKIITVIAVAGIVSLSLFAMLLSKPSGSGEDADDNPENPQSPPLSGAVSAPSTAMPSSEPYPAPSSEPLPSPVTTSAPALLNTITAYGTVNINETDEQLTAELNRVASSYYCTAASVAYFSPEDGFYTYQYGMADIGDKTPADEDTLFRVASLSKMVVAILTMSLADDGLLDIDEDISAYLGYNVRGPNHSDVPITSRMLLQHTASLSDYGTYNQGSVTWGPGTLKRLLADSSNHTGIKPGTRSEYANFGYVVLAAVCESASGKMLDALADEILFKPLDMTAAFAPYYLKEAKIASQYDIDNVLRLSGKVTPDTPNPADLGFQYNSAPGSLRISALDYARILYILINNGVYGDVRVLSEESVREIHDANVPYGMYVRGLCVWYQEDAFLGEDVYWHTGSAYGTFAQFIYSLDTKQIAVVVTTGGSGAREENSMLKSCLAFSEQLWQTSVTMR